ncbi:phage holin family protein [Dyadobacter subterraneus]|uniref:Phage holin family protein n=1 Tax=Dyadobacter subterraneus TaxID=2773304 RepID=A0ABR9WIW7_9BACT|nr:phage holin family protein [Dyadobacter subterraneus]MBE9465464.1 phage holin family protein [Dyadobacter subterraneus]
MFSQLEEIKDTLFKYFETRIDLFKIETRDKIERAAVTGVYALLILSIALVVLILIVILLGTFLNKWLHSDYLGYLILLGVFVLKLTLSIVFRTKLIGFIRNIIIRFVQIKED